MQRLISADEDCNTQYPSYPTIALSHKALFREFSDIFVSSTLGTGRGHSEDEANSD